MDSIWVPSEAINLNRKLNDNEVVVCLNKASALVELDRIEAPMGVRRFDSAADTMGSPYYQAGDTTHPSAEGTYLLATGGATAMVPFCSAGTMLHLRRDDPRWRSGTTRESADLQAVRFSGNFAASQQLHRATVPFRGTRYPKGSDRRRNG